MKTKQFRSILALAVVTASVATSLSPAQAFTWEDVWNTVRYGVEGVPAPKSPQTPDNSSDGQFDNSGEIQQPDPQKNKYTESSQTPANKCVNANTDRFIKGIGQDDTESMVSVGRKPVNVVGKLNFNSFGFESQPYEVTCSIEVHPADEKFRVSLTIPDNSELYSARVTLYVDGQEQISKIITRGQVGRYTIDITGANSFAYRIQRVNSDGNIYFLN